MGVGRCPREGRRRAEERQVGRPWLVFCVVRAPFEESRFYRSQGGRARDSSGCGRPNSILEGLFEQSSNPRRAIFDSLEEACTSETRGGLHARIRLYISAAIVTHVGLLICLSEVVHIRADTSPRARLIFRCKYKQGRSDCGRGVRVDLKGRSWGSTPLAPPAFRADVCTTAITVVADCSA